MIGESWEEGRERPWEWGDARHLIRKCRVGSSYFGLVGNRQQADVVTACAQRCVALRCVVALVVIGCGRTMDAAWRRVVSGKARFERVRFMLDASVVVRSG